MRFFLRAILVLTLVGHTDAFAASRVCIGGDLDHISSAQKAVCRATADRVQSTAARFGAPDNWHFFVLCTETDWETYASLSTGDASNFSTLRVNTDFKNRGVFFRGSWLSLADTDDFTKVVSHAVASAALETKDERAIQKRIALWTGPAEKKIPEQVAARSDF